MLSRVWLNQLEDSRNHFFFTPLPHAFSFTFPSNCSAYVERMKLHGHVSSPSLESLRRKASSVRLVALNSRRNVHLRCCGLRDFNVHSRTHSWNGSLPSHCSALLTSVIEIMHLYRTIERTRERVWKLYCRPRGISEVRTSHCEADFTVFSTCN